jgi:hypothetical protein
MALNNLQELQVERERLLALSNEHELKLKEDYAYLSENGGRIIIDATISAAQYRLGALLQRGDTETVENGEPPKSMAATLMGEIVGLVKENLTPMAIFRIIKPFAVAFVVRKIRKMFKR